jgi:hypothetical protein
MATTLQEFVRDLQGLAGKVQAQIGQKLINHQIGDWDEYNKLTGKAAGIAEMADLAYQLMKNRDMAAVDDPDDGLAGLPDDDDLPPGKPSKQPRGKR